jgi:SWI/SNF-related matrix-associated actin-dependent regulator of chromatin subfamily A3
MLTRLRQLALHPGLVPANYVEELRAAEANDGAPPKTIHITAEDKIRLQRVLGQAIEDCGECPICFGILDEARITSCSHIFCLPWSVWYFYSSGDFLTFDLPLPIYDSITEVISRDQKCPMVCLCFLKKLCLTGVLEL